MGVGHPASARFGVDQRAEVLDGLPGGEITGGAGIAHRTSGLVHAGLGEQDAEFDLAGAGAPVGRLPGPPRDLGGHHGNTGSVDGYVELGDRGARRERHQLTAEHRGGFGVEAGAQRRAVGLRAALHPLGGQLHSGQFGQQVVAFANGAAAPVRATIARSPGDSETPATPSSSSLGSTSCPHWAQW